MRFFAQVGIYKGPDWYTTSMISTQTSICLETWDPGYGILREKDGKRMNGGHQDCGLLKVFFYQIYPLGFCGAPPENDSILSPRILKVLDWIPHIQPLGANAIYFSPVWESDSHGYDTRDYSRLDVRLGTNEDFACVCRRLHESGIRVVLDGVFNHVGRGFWAFQDVLRNREQSAYRDWFLLILVGTTDTMTDSGMRAGRVILSWLS